MCAAAGGFPAATAASVDYTVDNVPNELTVDGDHVRLVSENNAFSLQTIRYESGALELYLYKATAFGSTTFPSTMLTVGSVTGNLAGTLLGGPESSLALSLGGTGTAVNLGERFSGVSVNLVSVGGVLQQYGGLDITLGGSTQHVAAGSWGETGNRDDAAGMRQTWLFHFDGSALSFEKAKRFADVVSETSTERLIRYYTADFGQGTRRQIEIASVSNDTATNALKTNGGATFGVNCRAAGGTLTLDSEHPTEGFSNVQKAVDARVDKTDGTTVWTEDREVVTLWLQGDNTIEAVAGGQASSLNVGTLQIRQGGSLTMNGTNLASDSILLAGSASDGATLTALNARVDTGLLQTVGASDSVIVIGGGLTADIADFQDAGTRIVLHIGEAAPMNGSALLTIGEATEATNNLLSAASGGSAVSVALDAASAASLVGAHIGLVSIGGTTQAYDRVTLTDRTLADGQWNSLDPGSRSGFGESVLLYQYEGGALHFDSTLRSIVNKTAQSYDAVNVFTGTVDPETIGSGIVSDVPLQAQVTDSRTVELAPDGSLTSVSDAVVTTNWQVERNTAIDSAGAAAGAIDVTALSVGTGTAGSGVALTIRNASLTVADNMNIGGGNTVAMGGSPLAVGGTLKLDGTLSLTIGSATPSPSTLVSAGAVSGAHASSLAGTSLGGDGIVSLALDTSNQGSNLLGKQVTLVSIGGTAQTYENLRLDDGTSIASGAPQSPGLYDLSYRAADGADVYLAYSFDGTTLTFGNSLSYVAPPDESTTETLPGGGSVVTETSVKTDKVRQDVQDGSFDAVMVDLPNAHDPSLPGTPVTVASNVAVEGNLHLEAATVSRIETVTTMNENGVVTDKQVNVHPVEASMTTLVVDDDVALKAADSADTCARVTVDQTIVHADQTLVLDNAELRTGLSLDVHAGGAIDARGEQTRIVIGGRTDLGGGLGEKTVSDIAGDIYLSQGAVLTAETVGGAAQQKPQIAVHDATIHLGVAKDDPDGEKTTGTIDGGACILAMENVSIHGTGTVRNVSMKNSSLTAGHSPGQLTLAYLEGHDMRLQVSILGANVQSGALNGDTTGETGAISQFVVGENVHIEGGLFSVVWQGSDAERARLTEGTAFQFFDFSGGTITGSLTVDESTLPELADSGLTWDFSQLMTTGIARIVGLQYADPSRMANTLVSAADVIAGFGNMLYGHAREGTPKNSNFWVSGLGDFSNLASRGGRTGYTYNGGGYAVGYNYVNACGSTLGIAFGQEFGRHEPKLGTSQYAPGRIDQDTLLFGLYGHGVLGKSRGRTIALDAYAAYGRVDNHSRKGSLASGESATAKWNDDVFAAGLMASCEYRVCTATVLRPFIALEFVHVSMDSFQEGDGSRSASYSDGKYANFSGSAGLQVYRPYELRNGMALTPSLSVAYVGDMVRHDGRVTATDRQGRSWRGRSVSPGRNGFQGTAALDWRISARWGMRAAYMIEARSGSLDQDVSLGVNYTF